MQNFSSFSISSQITSHSIHLLVINRKKELVIGINYSRQKILLPHSFLLIYIAVLLVFNPVCSMLRRSIAIFEQVQSKSFISIEIILYENFHDYQLKAVLSIVAFFNDHLQFCINFLPQSIRLIDFSSLNKSQNSHSISFFFSKI